MKSIRIFLLAVTMAFSAAWGDAECKLPLIRFATYPMSIHESGVITIPIAINGVSLTMMVDTGAYYSGLKESTVKKLGLNPTPLTDVSIFGMGGMITNMHVVADTVRIGPTDLRERPLFVLPEAFLPDNIDGILGTEILTAFDVDFDFAAGKLSFFLPKHCAGRVVYWTYPEVAAVLPITISIDRMIFVNVWLDGKMIPAILDSGTSNTTMGQDVAKFLFDVDREKLAKTGKHDFQSMRFGAVAVSHPDIDLLPGSDGRMLGDVRHHMMIVGENVLQNLHLYIAYGEGKIYITPAVIPSSHPAPLSVPEEKGKP